MLTGYQASTGAYTDEYGELYCVLCFEGEDVYCRPVSNYELDEIEAAWSYDAGFYEMDPDLHVEDCECQSPLYCSGCSNELTSGYVDTQCEDKQTGNTEEDDDE